ncbi:MAG: sugar MFS transporter [Bacteroidota bacterium]
MTHPSPSSRYGGAFATVTSLFFLWGFLTVFVDALIPRLRLIFELSYAESGLVQVAFFTAYGLVSIPAGLLLPRIGYQRGMMLGLFTMAAGCLLFWPAAESRVFGLFLGGLFVLAAGMTILQVAANPYVAVLGPPDGASSRLNLAQAFNSLGTTIAPILSARLILSDGIQSAEAIRIMPLDAKEIYFAAEAAAVRTPFLTLAIAMALLAVVLRFIRLPEIISKATSGNFSAALANKRLMLGALGIFIYVGAEVTIGSYLVHYLMSMDIATAIREHATMRAITSQFIDNLDTAFGVSVVGTYVAVYWGGAMVGRFIGALLTKLFRPGLILSIFGGSAIGLLLLSMSTDGFPAMWSILGVGLFNSIMFPTIFTLAIEKLGEHQPQGSGILCSAIVGGAVIPPLFGKLVDWSAFKPALALLVLCYAFILFYGHYTGRDAAKTA